MLHQIIDNKKKKMRDEKRDYKNSKSYITKQLTKIKLDFDNLSEKDIELAKNLRVNVFNVVFVRNIPPQILELTEKQLCSVSYFGKYGKMQSIDICNAQNTYTRLFLKYQSTISAALAIKAINSFYHNRYDMQASYGTGRYCFSVYYKSKCSTPNCKYIHERRQKYEVLAEQRHLLSWRWKSEDEIKNNLKHAAQLGLIEQKYSRKKDSKQQIVLKLPTIEQTIDFMANNQGQFKYNEYVQMKKKVEQEIGRKQKQLELNNCKKQEEKSQYIEQKVERFLIAELNRKRKISRLQFSVNAGQEENVRKLMFDYLTKH